MRLSLKQMLLILTLVLKTYAQQCGFPLDKNSIVYLTSAFGSRYLEDNSRYDWHGGLDIGASSSELVWAIEESTVLYIWNQDPMELPLH